MDDVTIEINYFSLIQSSKKFKVNFAATLLLYYITEVYLLDFYQQIL